MILKIDDNTYLEGSGSLRPDDGLSARFFENGKEYVSSGPPESLKQIVLLLQSYRSGDGRWRTMLEWG